MSAEDTSLAARPSTTNLASACGELFVLTIKRQLLSRQTLVCLALTVLCAVIVWAVQFRPSHSPKRFADWMLLPTFVTFLMPVFAISYGASGIGGEREDRSLIYLLITPIPRPWLYLTKAFATLVLVAGWSAGALALFCALAGSDGQKVFGIFLMASVLGSMVYASLFLALGAAFRYGTILSLAYWFFLEVLFSQIPGIVKRVTVVFYVKCMVFDAGEELNLGPTGRVGRELFLAVSGETAMLTLACALVSLLAIGAAVLTSREYSELG